MNLKSLVIALFLGLSGCSSGSGSTELRPLRSGNFIGEEEIERAKSPALNAYELISDLRPGFLRSRGAQSLRDTRPVTANVYLDSVLLGSLETLKTINAGSIRTIAFINAADATTRFGTDHGG